MNIQYDVLSLLLALNIKLYIKKITCKCNLIIRNMSRIPTCIDVNSDVYHTWTQRYTPAISTIT